MCIRYWSWRARSTGQEIWAPLVTFKKDEQGKEEGTVRAYHSNSIIVRPEGENVTRSVDWVVPSFVFGFPVKERNWSTLPSMPSLMIGMSYAKPWPSDSTKTTEGWSN